MTTKLSAGDWTRLQRLKAAKQYLENDQDINPTPNPQLPYSKAMLIPPTVGTSKYRRMASQWLDYKASQSADYIINGTRVRLCDCDVLRVFFLKSLWSNFIATSGSSRSTSISFDSEGNVYVSGFYTATSAFDLGNGVSLPISTIQRSFLIKYNSNGIALWANSVVSTGVSSGNATAVDSLGNVYVTGNYISTTSVDLGNGQNLPVSASTGTSQDAFLIKYNSAGVAQWAKVIPGGTGSDSGLGLAIDSLDNVYMVGSYIHTGTLTIQTTPTSITLGATQGVSAGFLVKYNSAGTALFAKSVNDGETANDRNESCNAVTIDPSGNIWVVGNYNSDLGLNNDGGITLPITTSQDVFLVRYDSGGTPNFATRIINGSGTDNGLSIDTDSAGNVYVGGSYISTNPIGTLPASGATSNGFLLKYNNSGVLQWENVIAGTGADIIQSVQVDSSGNVYIGGSYTSTTPISLGGSAVLPISTALDAFVVKYDTNGNPQFSNTFAGTAGDASLGIGISPSGELYITGYYRSTSSITINDLESTNVYYPSSNILPASGAVDNMFLIKFSL
jgi:hypothetical protein